MNVDHRNLCDGVRRDLLCEHGRGYWVPMLAALPGKQALMEMTNPMPIRIMLLEVGTGDALAVDTVSTPGAVLFSFPNSDAPLGADTQWRDAADQLAGGFDSLMLGA